MDKIITIDFSKPSTQREAVLWHLHNYGRLSSWQAIKEYGITRLSSIIHGLRREGYNITSDPKTTTNRFGNSVTIAEYVYVKPVPKHESGKQLSLMEQINESHIISIKRNKH